MDSNHTTIIINNEPSPRHLILISKRKSKIIIQWQRGGTTTMKTKLIIMKQIQS